MRLCAIVLDDRTFPEACWTRIKGKLPLHFAAKTHSPLPAVEVAAPGFAHVL